MSLTATTDGDPEGCGHVFASTSAWGQGQGDTCPSLLDPEGADMCLRLLAHRAKAAGTRVPRDYH